jgi:Cdc6-like AAA superfamily ATPase
MIDNYDDLEMLEKYLPREAFEYLYYLLEGATIDDIVQEIQEGVVNSDDFNNQIDSANNRRNFIEVKDDRDIEELLSGDLQKWKIFLHPSQRIISGKYFNGSFKVSGAAGTGKTVLALHRLKHLSLQTKRSKDILFTTFTKSLASNLKDSINSLDIDNDKVVLTNIHNVIIENAKEERLIEADSKIIEFLNREQKAELWKETLENKLSEYDSEFLMREYENVILFHDVKNKEQYLTVPRIGMETPLGRRDRIKVWDLVTSFINTKLSRKIYYLDEVTNLLTNYYQNNPQKPFSHIIADEIQDFSDVQLRLLRSMVTEKENDLFLVGDPLQNIYNRNLNYSRAGINIRGAKSRRLRVNYRTTEEIKKARPR